MGGRQAPPRPRAPLAVALVVGLAAPLPGPARAADAGSYDWFEEVAARSGLDFVYANGMTGELYFAEIMGGGAALLDYDNDGDLDVYLVQGGSLGEAASPPAGPSDRLFRNDGWSDADGRHVLAFVDVTARAGVEEGVYGMGVASADVDNDGWPDLFVTNFGPNRLLRNRGDGTFVETAAAAGIDDPRWSVAASFFDFDRDGRLDLYVGQYVDYRIAAHRPCYSAAGRLDYCAPSDFPGETDRLYRNRGDGRFEDVSKRSGIGREPGASLGSIAADLDGDGLPDLYVATDGYPNQLWRNQGDGTFVDTALLSGTAVNSEGRAEASMGVALGDTDGDGVDDLLLTHLFGESHTLYAGLGAGLYADRSYESGVGVPSLPDTGFGVSLSDFDNDGDLDLYVANGAVKRLEGQLLAGESYPLRQPNRLWINEGSGRLVDVSARGGPALALDEVSRGVASGDLEGDGDLDLVVVNSQAPVRLLVNRASGEAGWIGLKALGFELADALGARAEVELGDGRRLPRRVATDGSYASSSDPRAHWGLGEASVTRLDVLWPAGARTSFRRPRAGHYLVVREPRP